MKNLYTLYFVFLLILIIPYNALSQQSEKENSENIQSAWLKAINEATAVDSFYTDGSGILINDELFIGKENINMQLQSLKNNFGALTDYTAIEVFQLRENQKFVLGVYKTKSGQIINTIIGWKFRNNWTKAFEVIYNKTEDFTSGINAVNKKREDWETLSNQHRPDLIVSEVFMENGKYFNRGKQYLGKEIIDAYSYMSHESYKIKLEALNVLQVNSNIIFDIGTFTAGGKGLYTLIWKKTNGEWELLLDFNF